MYVCKHCGDPAVIVQEIKEPFWPFKVSKTLTFCYECHQEINNGKLPKLTDSSYRSRKGSGIQKRKRLQE